MTVDGGLRRLFRQRLPLVDFAAVESHRSGRGLPDTNYCVAGCEGWIEFKSTAGWKVKVSAEQVGWAERRIAAGGRVLLAVSRKDELYLYSATALRRFRSGLRLFEVEPLMRGDLGPSRWDWDEVLAIMMMTPGA